MATFNVGDRIKVDSYYYRNTEAEILALRHAVGNTRTGALSFGADVMLFPSGRQAFFFINDIARWNPEKTASCKCVDRAYINNATGGEMKKYRVMWTQKPTAYHNSRVLFVEANSPDDAMAIAIDHVERTCGVPRQDFIIGRDPSHMGVKTIEEVQPVPAGRVVAS